MGSWLRPDQMYSIMPQSVADALIKAAKGKPEWEKRHSLAPENDALATYRAIMEDKDTQTETNQSYQQRKTTGTMDRETAVGNNPFSSEPVSAPADPAGDTRTPEEIAAEAEKKRKEKEERAEAAKKKKATAEYRRKTFLEKAPNLKLKIKEMTRQTGHAMAKEHMREAVLAEYKGLFRGIPR